MTDISINNFLQNSITQLIREKSELQITYEDIIQQNKIAYENKINELYHENEKLKFDNQNVNKDKTLKFENETLKFEIEKQKFNNKKLYCKTKKCFTQEDTGSCKNKDCLYNHYCRFNNRCNNSSCKLIHTYRNRDRSPTRKEYNYSYRQNTNSYRHRTPSSSRNSSPTRNKNSNNITLSKK